MTNSSPLAGEEGARGVAVGRRGVALARARAMRREPTEAERILWRLLRAHRFADWKWRRQQPLGPYIVDFVCLEARVIVEADGLQHLESEYDRRRDAWLRAQDFRILRFSNNDVLARTDQVREAIYHALNDEAAASSPPLPRPLSRKGRGEQKDDPRA
jgi:very-short-patch-repair endonuclease